MKSFILVHNIASPYRIYLFNLLDEQLSERGVRFHVHFMARTEHGRRHWDSYADNISFSHSFWKDIGPTLGRIELHLNPGILTALLYRQHDYLMLGGPWASFTGILVTLFARRKVGIAWGEGNTITPGRISGWPLLFKRFLLERFQVMAVPGQEGFRYKQLILQGSKKPPKVVLLPNVVDERLFRPSLDDSDDERGEVRRKLGLDLDTRIAFWPARLIAVKGVCEFLSKFGPSDFKGWKLVILGEGPLIKEVEAVIERKALANHVVLSPYWTYDRMPFLYRAVDLFVLPSLSDTNPLSVVEALHSGLPIVVSNRIGNFPEALKEGINGWGLDPFDRESVRSAMLSALKTNPNKLREMGEQSRVIAADFWGSKKAINAFLDAIPIEK